MPEPLVEVDRELPVGGQRAQRPVLEEELRVLVEVLERLALEDEEAPRDDALRHGLLRELDDTAAGGLHLAVARGGVHARHRGEPALAPVVVEQRADVDVGDGVAVGQAEGGRALEVAPHAPQAGAGGGVGAGLGAGHPPALDAVGVVELGRPAAVHRHREVAQHLLVAQEVLLDLPALVAEAQHEAVEPVGPVVLHDVPEDGAVAHLHHRLGAVLGLLAQPRALAAAEDDHRDVPPGGTRLAARACHRGGDSIRAVGRREGGGRRLRDRATGCTDGSGCAPG